MSELSKKDLAVLSVAVSRLERPSFAAKLAAVIGVPVEKLLGWLPDSIQTQIDTLTEDALAHALSVARKTLSDATTTKPWNLTHKVAATLSGVTGGMFGAPALFAELPVTTVIIMRSIADIARSHGEDLSTPEVQLACLEVFALGSMSKQDATDVATTSAQRQDSYIRSSYFVSRAAMAQQVTAAAEILAKGTTPAGGSALTRLVENLLDMARLDSGSLALNRQWHVLEEIVGVALTSAKRELQHHKVCVKIPADFPLLHIDGFLIEQVLVNLLENASRYTPAGSEIHITAASKSHIAEVRVSDNGPGLPAGSEEKVFDKFFRGASVSPDGRRGVGLGLAICRAIVDAHHGKITAANRRDGGAEFTFTLPCDETPPRIDAELVATPARA